MTHNSDSVSDWLNYITHDEINFLKQLAVQLTRKSPHAINIGAGGGTSALAFLESRPDLHLTTIDIQFDSSPYGCIEGELLLVKEAGYFPQNRYNYIVGDSKVVGEHWGEQNIGVDLVFVDGGHDYEQAKADIVNWKKNLNKGGILAVHDYKKTEVYQTKHPEVNANLPEYQAIIKAYPGVDLAVDELLLNKRGIKLIGRVDTTIAFSI